MEVQAVEVRSYFSSVCPLFIFMCEERCEGERYEEWIAREIAHVNRCFSSIAHVKQALVLAVWVVFTHVLNILKNQQSVSLYIIQYVLYANEKRWEFFDTIQKWILNEGIYRCIYQPLYFTLYWFIPENTDYVGHRPHIFLIFSAQTVHRFKILCTQIICST